MDQVDIWFFSNDEFAKKINEFVERHLNDFIVDQENGVERDDTGVVGNYLFSADDDDDEGENRRRRAHRRKDVHNAFTELFEVSLEEFIRSKRIAFDQFQQVFQISQDEEVRDGEKFYRWVDAAEYEVFLKVMQQTFANRRSGDSSTQPCKILREIISKRMEDARLALRRRKNIRPLLDEWDLYDFNQLLRVLQDPSCPKPTVDGGQEEKKYLARWRVNLVQQQRESTEGKTSREVMTEYIGRSTEQYSDQDFTELLAFIKSHIEKLPLNEAQKRRRLVWQLFSVLDQRYTGLLLFEPTLKFLQRNPDERFHGKEFKKVQSKWAALIKKSNTEKLEIDIEQFQGFIGELLADLPFPEFERTVSGWTALKVDLDT